MRGSPFVKRFVPLAAGVAFGALALDELSNAWGEWGAVVGGGVFGFFAVFSALSFNKKRREMQKMNQLSLAEISGAAAHNINNLLTGISGALSVLERSIEKGDKKTQNRIMGTIDRSVERCRGVTEELLNVSRAQRGRNKITKVNLVKVINEVVSMLSLLEESFKHRLTVVAPERDINIACDESGLHQVLLNLGTNAIDAMTNPGVLTFEVKGEEPGQIVLVVRDTGLGMAPDVMKSMFEPFFTTKSARSKDTIGGSGLGLSSVKYLVECWGGELECESNVGTGTVFTLHFSEAGPEFDEIPTDSADDSESPVA